MKIEFTPGEPGYREARELRTMMRFIRDNTVAGSHDLQLMDLIGTVADEQMSRPEFSALRSTPGESGENRPLLRRIRDTFGAMLGPSRNEMLLAKQRIDALERADRAERSTFEAVAEAAKMGDARDEAQAQLQALQEQIEVLQTQLKSLAEAANKIEEPGDKLA